MNCQKEKTLKINEVTNNEDGDCIIILNKGGYFFSYNTTKNELHQIGIFKGSRFISHAQSLMDCIDDINEHIKECEDIPNWEDKLNESH